MSNSSRDLWKDSFDNIWKTEAALELFGIQYIWQALWAVATCKSSKIDAFIKQSILRIDVLISFS